MVAVFAGFASGELTELQQMGFGLGVAVLMDATIVRTVLVPASMRLLGDWNWYLPGWLAWLPELQVERVVDVTAVVPPDRPAPASPEVPRLVRETAVPVGSTPREEAQR